MSIIDEFKEATEPVEVNYDELISTLEIDISKPVKQPESIIDINGEVWGTLGGLSVVMGKAKTKKTFFVTAATAAMLTSKSVLGMTGKLPVGKRKILYFDTEQSEYHVSKVGQRVCKMAELPPTTDRFRIFKLNPISTKKRLGLIDHVFKTVENIDMVGVVIIDGIRDLLFDINNSTEATELVDYIRKWTDTTNTHIITVLHANKTDGNLRGHIGTELLNKGETILEVVIDGQDKNISVVSCERSRNKPFEDFAFSINDAGIPVVCDMPVKSEKKVFDVEEQIGADAIVKILVKAYNNRNEPKTKSELKDIFSLKVKIKDAKARLIVAYCVDKQYIENVSNNKKNYKYVLNDWVGVSV